MRELEENPRLEHVVEICAELCIDDPVCWMNATDPKTVDLWIARRLRKMKLDNDSAAFAMAQQGIDQMGIQPWQP